ncbi:hypothetical protein CALCODRAFT_273063 [Calocera cornea HHB12733]|uniref:Uncharacterized protein n=1 Tax=Calocera cornea HHB12733 TaxID=1353952 RepID=A0A165G6X7_9BASI|nr:hypothetical protein CALCODRAFT_273063 [Calocera cornea HHB12733]
MQFSMLHSCQYDLRLVSGTPRQFPTSLFRSASVGNRKIKGDVQQFVGHTRPLPTCIVSLLVLVHDSRTFRACTDVERLATPSLHFSVSLVFGASSYCIIRVLFQTFFVVTFIFILVHTFRYTTSYTRTAFVAVYLTSCVSTLNFPIPHCCRMPLMSIRMAQSQCTQTGSANRMKTGHFIERRPWRADLFYTLVCK